MTNTSTTTLRTVAEQQGAIVEQVACRLRQSGLYTDAKLADELTALYATPQLANPAQVTENGIEEAAKIITKWLGYSWGGLYDGRVTDKGFPIFTHGQFGWGFQGHKGDMIDLARTALTAAIGAGGQSFQQRVQPWMMACFGPEISADKLERSDRLAEEVLELLQSGGYPRERVAALTDYVYGRDIGEPAQEAGGVMVTLAAYCLAHDLDMHECGETELARIWTKVEKIRAKQAAKPTGSALPVAHQPHPADERVVEALRAAYEKVKLWPENRMPGVDVTELGEGFMDLLALRNLIPDVLAALTKEGR